MKKYYTLFYFLLLLITSLFAQDKILFQEEFNNNNQNWLLANEAEATARIANGKYILEHISPNGAQLFFNNNVRFNPNQNFEITTHLKQLAGNQQYGYGLVWGAKNGNNFFAFTISSDGKCNIYRFEEGEFINIRPWVRLGNQIVKPLGDINLLRIKKQENRMSFFINNELIHTADYHPFMGNQLGFVLNSKMKVVVGDVMIKRPLEDAEKEAKPKVTWVNPNHELSTIFTKTIHIEALIETIYPIRGARLLVNDEVYGGVIGGKNYEDEVTSLKELVAEELVLQTGINEIVLIVEDIQGNRTMSKRIIKVDSKTESTDRKDYALLFATNEYENWSDLTNPIFDAKAIAKELTERYGFEVEIVQNASKSQMMGKLKQYAKKAYNPHDQLFVFFAGHGQYDEDFKEGYVVCNNSLLDDDGNTSYLPHSILRTIINNIPCQHTFLMMDVCFGGTFDQNLTKHRGGNGRTNVYQEISQQQFIARKLQFKTRKFVTSGGKEYVPDGIPGNHSPFARKILEALRNNGGNDNILTYTELLNYVERVQPSPHHGEFGDNEPGSDFLFIVKY